MDGEIVICHQCIEEKYVKSVIKSQGSRKFECSYCHHRRTNIPVSVIAELMHQVFENYYEPESEFYYNDVDNGDSAKDVIQQELGVDEQIADNIFDELCEQHNPLHWDEGQIYDEDYVYVGRQFSTGKMHQAWEDMRNSLAHDTRFFNRTVKKFLDELFSDIEEFRTDREESPIKAISGDTLLYRARYFESLRAVKQELRHPERNFGPPPSHLARSGRMNAHGIAVFYGATTPEIAIAEIRPPVGAHVIVAPFVARKELRVLDISALDALVYSKKSVFDPQTIKSLERTAFLKTFSHKLTLPVFNNQDSGYLITQVIAEYLSVSEQFNLDGISFRSTQVKKETTKVRRRAKKENGHNVVLFSKSSGVWFSGENERAYRVSLTENLEYDINYFHPSLQLIEDEPSDNSIWSYSFVNNNDKTLELLTGELQYYLIEGVLFQNAMTAIELGVPVKRRHENKRLDDIDPF
ncbi:TPA: RES family NAD+ phosphorylase [Enterobacter asburiae]|nr:RES family NAD+ phosphorylase [Enterobacter asburiae]HDR2372455.1 RES family NAD+ phosphorylase [Enterobacter asburiae]